MVDSFHLRHFLSSSGSCSEDTSLWSIKFRVGGTLGNNDILSGGESVVEGGMDTQVFLWAASPREMVSRFSPTNVIMKKVLEQCHLLIELSVAELCQPPEFGPWG